MKDALNRRSRFARPQPTKSVIELTERDYLIFEALDRHGKLPTNYIFEFIKHQYKNYGELQRRLTELYNGYCDRPEHRRNVEHACLPISYVSRDWQQFNNMQARYQPAVYGLTPISKKILNQEGRGQMYSPERNDPFVHQFFAGCFSASVELQAYEFISREDILRHPNCPSATRLEKNPFAIPTFLPDMPSLVPDILFGLKYDEEGGGGFRFFAVEIDRNTETIRPTAPVKNSIAKKVRGYDSILAHRTYEKHFGLPNLTVLFATTNVVHMARMKEYVAESSTKPEKFLFKAFPTFGENWRVPRELLPVFDPWESVKGNVDISRR